MSLFALCFYFTALCQSFILKVFQSGINFENVGVNMKCLSKNARNGTVDAFLSAILASYEESGVEDENLKKIFALIKSLQSGLSSAII